MTTKDRLIAPGAEKDWSLDWAEPGDSYLQDGETLTSRTVTVTGGIEKISDAIEGSKVRVWVRAPEAMALGQKATVLIAIVTSADRKDSRRIELTVGYGAIA